MRPRDPRLLLPILAALLCLNPAGAEEAHEFCAHHNHGAVFGPRIQPRAFDAETGENPRQYPPDLFVDYTHLRLEIDLDLEAKRLEVNETLRFVPIAEPIASLSLDAVGLDIRSVAREDGGPVRHYYDGQRLTALFDEPLQPGRPCALLIEYVCEDPPAGLYFAPGGETHPHRPTVMHSQGEDILNRYWMVCHDSPNDQLATEMLVTVEKPNMAVSNGVLVETIDRGDEVTYHWRQEKEHVVYLVSLCVGQWDVVEDEWRGLDVDYYVPPGRAEDGMATYQRTPEMLEFFSERFGYTYPWDKYAQVVIENFLFGGMENTSATTMWEGAVYTEAELADGDLDGLISHELAHQWFGDLMTCESWDHIWLNEGFATYSTALWNEHRHGYDDYLLSINGSMSGVANSDRAGRGFAMVWNDWKYSMDTIRTPGANPYSKGSSVLAMLRAHLGDELFFKGVKHYVNRHAFSVVETHDLREAMEAATGRSLRWFFDQWCYRSGVPELETAIAYNPADSTLQIDVTQVQHIDREAPAFRFTLPVWVKFEDGSERIVEIESDARTAQRTVETPAAPTAVAIDPHVTLLKKIRKAEMNRDWHAGAFVEGPTVVSRINAADALAGEGDEEISARLAWTLNDAAEHEALRSACASALAAQKTDRAAQLLRQTLSAGVDDPRVRRAVIDAVAAYESADDAALFAALSQTEESPACRASAIRALGRLKAVQYFDVVASAAEEIDFRRNIIHNAALDALGNFDTPEAFDLLVKYTAYGYPFRTRPDAISKVAALAHHDPQRAYAVCEALLDDPEERSFTAAMDALARLGDSRAIPALQRIAETRALPWHRDWAAWAIAEIEGDGN